MTKIETSHYNLAPVGEADGLWRYAVRATGRSVAMAPPAFEIDGKTITARTTLTPVGEPNQLTGGVTEHRWAGPLVEDAGMTLTLILRIAEDSPVVRFCYTLHSDRPVRLTKASGTDSLTYGGTSLQDWPTVTEIRLAEFSEMVHSFCLSERTVTEGDFEGGLRLIGPLLAATDGSHALLLGYEHGSQVPDAFLAYDLAPDRSITLRAVKGSYGDGQIVDAEHPFTTVWLQVAAMAGSQDALATAYRDFVLRRFSVNAESRKPYIFYNTWNFQERNKWWNGKAYLDSMIEERILAEIDTACRMGIEVFVLDTGWYEKTGDWRVNHQRFPDGLKTVKARLDSHGMKLGLWFNPTVAAVSSRMRAEHEDCLMSWRGHVPDPQAIWETEPSQGLCLVSRYADAFADELIRLTREVGVTYFKWDAISQYGCDAAGHDHGTEDNTPQERADRYAFALGGAMARIVDRLCAACPEAIVDFDITEGGRTVGLQFLSAGKYFLINNGPYSSNYDMPTPADGNVNLFFYPGPARAWVCRTPLTYDKWIPSALFLTHYLPDDIYMEHGWNGPHEVRTDANQWISLASLVLGQHGIWGDLLGVSAEGVARFGDTLALYRQVRDDATTAALTHTGTPGGSPEVYEKIAGNGRGVVSLFAAAPGRYTYVTRSAVSQSVWHNAGVTVSFDGTGRAKIEAEFDAPGAKLLFFGVTG